jgi:hypothetical protein
MRETRTIGGVTYAPGARFRVVAEGVKLSGWVCSGPYSWSGWGQDLKPGDVITCTGFGADTGSDPGYGVQFTSEASIAAGAGGCDVRPMAGGMFDYRPAPGLLELVEASDG